METLVITRGTAKLKWATYKKTTFEGKRDLASRPVKPATKFRTATGWSTVRYLSRGNWNDRDVQTRPTSGVGDKIPSKIEAPTISFLPILTWFQYQGGKTPAQSLPTVSSVFSRRGREISFFSSGDRVRRAKGLSTPVS